jgi:DNA mismatch repair ATPase MutS
LNRFSILYNDDSLNAHQHSQAAQDIREEGYNFHNILNDLNVREISKFTNLSSKDIDYVLNIMADFKSSEEDVKMRLGVLKDFMNIRGFFDIFDTQMNYFNEIKEKLVNAKRNMMRVHADVSGETSFLNYNKIVSSCFFLSLTYKAIYNLYREFKFPQIESPRLLKLGEFLIDLVENSQFKQLDEECRIFNDHVNEGVIFDVDIKMNSILRIISLRLNDLRYIKPAQSGLFFSVMRALAIEEKTKKNKAIYIEKTFTQESLISSMDDAYLKGTIEFQINLIARRLASIYETLIDLFSNLSTELMFYRYALNMIGYMRQSNIPYCLAEVSDNRQNQSCSAEFEGLCDITLATAYKNSEFTVIRNDYILKEKDNINIIIGANQSGKTTFLRSFGSALVFARAGLPVPAATAKVTLFKNLYTHFQRYDEDLKNEGQLDTELTEMETIVYSASRDSMILMNESFSSTGLKDATQIAEDVLSALNYTGSKVVYVTHIPDMRDKLREGVNLDDESKKNINLYKTGQKEDGSPSFKLEKIV